jgi:hypothetical protein
LNLLVFYSLLIFTFLFLIFNLLVYLFILFDVIIVYYYPVLVVNLKKFSSLFNQRFIHEAPPFLATTCPQVE